MRPLDESRAYTSFRRWAHRLVTNAARSLNYDVLWKTFYNGVPQLDEIPGGVWTRRSAMAGIAAHPDRWRNTVRELVQAAVDDGFSPPIERRRPGEYFSENGSFGLGDAAVLWGLLRQLKPNRVLELGSGYSTMLIAEVLHVNEGDDVRAHHLVIDPYPSEALLEGISRPFDLMAKSVTDVGVEPFVRLRANDVLFVDTTHTVKVGGDVSFIVLDSLPLLQPGVHVHIHDIFLPFEYPRRFFELGYNWSEQYLLQAFLQFNSEFEIVAPVHQVAREDGAAFHALGSSSSPDAATCASFWIRRLGPNPQPPACSVPGTSDSRR